MNSILERLGAPPQGYGNIYEDHTPSENRERANKVEDIGRRYIRNISDAKKITGVAAGYWRFEEPWFHKQVSSRTYMGLNNG